MRKIIPLISLIFLAGCASGPVAYKIRTAGDPVINRDESGSPLSVVVRVYQLKDRKEFAKLSFDALSSGRSDEELLGADLIERSEVIVVPGTQSFAATTLNPEAKYVGVVGLFRQPDINNWRYLIKADNIRSNSVGISVSLGNMFKAEDIRTTGLSFTVRDCSLELIAPDAELLAGQTKSGKPVCAAPEEASASAAAPAKGTTGTAPAKAKGNHKNARKSSSAIAKEH